MNEPSSNPVASLGQVLYALMYQEGEDAIRVLKQAIASVEAMSKAQDSDDVSA